MAHPIASALHHETADYRFSTEYPIESKHEAKDPFFTTANNPLEQTHLNSKVHPQVQPDYTTHYAYDDVSHQGVDDFLQRMKAIVAENMARVEADSPAIQNTKPSSSSAMLTSHTKTSLRGNARRNSSVNISKADFMLVSSSSSSRHGSISEKNGSDSSFVKRIMGTSTPVKKSSNKQQLASQKTLSAKQHSGNSSKRRTNILEEMNKNAAGTSGSSSHRYSMRTRTSACGIRKTSTTPNKPVKSRTFNFGSSKKR